MNLSAPIILGGKMLADKIADNLKDRVRQLKEKNIKPKLT